MPDLHGDAGLTLEYGDVDRLVKWLMAIAYQAETVTAWDLLEGAAESIFYLDHWDCWRVQADIRSWLVSRSGHAVSVVAAAPRRNSDLSSSRTSWNSRATDGSINRIRQELDGTA